MANLFYQFGQNIGTAWRKGCWVYQSLTGSEADAIQAEENMGRDLAAALLQEISLDPDQERQKEVAGWGEYLKSRLVGNTRAFAFQIIIAEEANAFALPGGHVFVTRTLLERCGWDRDEGMFVLGHEMGHIVKGHALERMMAGVAVSAATRVMPHGRLIRGKVAEVAGTFMNSAYSRAQEFEADLFGLRLLRSGGLEARSALKLLQRLDQQFDLLESSPLHQYLSTHPPASERISELERRIQAWSGRS